MFLKTDTATTSCFAAHVLPPSPKSTFYIAARLTLSVSCLSSFNSFRAESRNLNQHLKSLRLRTLCHPPPSLTFPSCSQVAEVPRTWHSVFCYYSLQHSHFSGLGADSISWGSTSSRGFSSGLLHFCKLPKQDPITYNYMKLYRVHFPPVPGRACFSVLS